MDDIFRTSATTNMTRMFYYFKSANPSLTLGSNFDTSNVTNMCEMFKSSNFSYITLGSGFNTSSVTNMGSMFAGDHLVRT